MVQYSRGIVHKIKHVVVLINLIDQYLSIMDCSSHTLLMNMTTAVK